MKWFPPAASSLALALLASAGLTSAGCARVDVTHVEPGSVAEGVHFSRPLPFLVISRSQSPKVSRKSESTGSKPPEGSAPTRRESEEVGPSTKFTARIVYLPDPCQEYVIDWNYANVPGITLKDGWQLVQMGAESEGDPKLSQGAADVLAGQVLKAGDGSPEGFYRIYVGKDGSLGLFKQTKIKVGGAPDAHSAACPAIPESERGGKRRRR